MPTELRIQRFTLGPWGTNAYLLTAAAGRDCWIVDPGFEPTPLLAAIRAARYTPQAILLTHGHCDHIAGIPEVRAEWPKIPICIHEEEADFLTDPNENLSGPFGLPFTCDPPDLHYEVGKPLPIAGFDFEVRHTPGHSPGGVTLYQPDSGVALVGDTLFRDSIGRHDFPHSDGPALFRSIQTQLLTLPDDTRVLPGHGDETTIARERQRNPFLQDL